MIHFVKVSATALKSSGSDELAQGLSGFTKQVLANREMWIMVMIVIIGILLVKRVEKPGCGSCMEDRVSNRSCGLYCCGCGPEICFWMKKYPM